MSVADLNPDVPGLTGRIGGPLGKRVRRSGVWFDPVPWVFGAAVFTWIVVMLRQIPCIQTSVMNPINNYLRLCYSDIPILYQVRDWWNGAPLYTGSTFLEYPSLTAFMIWWARGISSLFGAKIGPDVSSVDRLNGANIFFGVTAVLLFLLFLVTVWAHLQMGKNSASRYTEGVRTRAWDAMFIALAPVVMATGIINWDMLAVALTSVGILFWSRKRPVVAGVIIGLACSAKFYPLIMVPVLFLLCLRAAKMKPFGMFMLGGVLGWGVTNVPVMVKNFHAWEYFWTFNEGRGPDLGSLWYVLSMMGVKISNVSVLEVIFLAICGAGIIWLVLVAPRRPRVGQVAFLVLVAFLAFNKVFSPQYMLWLLPILVLARPKIKDLLIFTIAEVQYFCAVFGFLEGILDGDARPWYWASTLLRIGVELWLASRVVADIMRPWQDTVRGPFVDDPIGGVLDHAPDAAWLLRPAAMPDAQTARRSADSEGASDSKASANRGMPDSVAVQLTERPDL